MKNNLLKYYMFAFYLGSTFVMFAQPGDNDDTGGMEDDGDITPVPMDDYLWILALVGLFFVYMKFRAIQNKKINS